MTDSDMISPICIILELASNMQPSDARTGTGRTGKNEMQSRNQNIWLHLLKKILEHVHHKAICD